MSAARDLRLARLIAHAAREVPYYRRLFQRVGIRPEEIRGVADLSRLPITAKSDLQPLPAHEVVAHSVRHRRLGELRTSGSSGEPFVVRRTLLEQLRLDQRRRRAYHELGLRLRDRAVRIGFTRRSPEQRGSLGRLLRRTGLYRRTTLDTFAEPERIASWLEELRPDVVGGYPETLARVAEAADGRVRPRLAITGAEVLTPEARRRIAEGFGCEVRDTYASMEFNLMAWECPVTGDYHVCDDSVVLEVLGPDGCPVAPGEQGEVVATSLVARAMPFIRYRLGDLVTLGTERCRCGAPWSTIRKIRGRMIDYFRLPGGRLVHPYQISDRIVWETVEWVRRYRMVQQRENRIVLQVVPAFLPSQQETDRMLASVRAFLGQSVEFELVLVEALPLEPSGKFRTSRTLLGSPFDGVSRTLESVA